MKIVVLPAARDDLKEGFRFYECQGEGLGDYFLDSLFSDIDFGFLQVFIRRFTDIIVSCRNDSPTLSITRQLINPLVL